MWKNAFKDNRKKLLVTEVSNINDGKAEKDFIKMLVLFRGKKISCVAALREQNHRDETISSV